MATAKRTRASRTRTSDTPDIGVADRIGEIKSESCRLSLDLWAGERYAGQLELSVQDTVELACRLLSMAQFASDRALTDDERAFLYELADAKTGRPAGDAAAAG